MTDRASLVRAAMSLPDKERLDLAEQLLKSVSPDEDLAEMNDEEFGAELLRRKAEMDDGTDSGIPWSELKDLD